MILSRRGLLTGMTALLAAPAIVRASSLMPVVAVRSPLIVGDGKALMSAVHPGTVYIRHGAFGMAILKEEGLPTSLDPLVYEYPTVERLFVGDILVLGSDGSAHRADHLVQSKMTILGVAATNSRHPFDDDDR